MDETHGTPSDATGPLRGQIAPILESLADALPDLTDGQAAALERAMSQVALIGVRVGMAETVAGLAEAGIAVDATLNDISNDGEPG